MCGLPSDVNCVRKSPPPSLPAAAAAAAVLSRVSLRPRQQHYRIRHLPTIDFTSFRRRASSSPWCPCLPRVSTSLNSSPVWPALLKSSYLPARRFLDSVRPVDYRRLRGPGVSVRFTLGQCRLAAQRACRIDGDGSPCGRTDGRSRASCVAACGGLRRRTLR